MSNIKKIMIFGRPGSGKSTFAVWLSHKLGLPLYHLDKYFFVENWMERNYQEFLQIQQEMVNTNAWVIDGNSTKSLELRYSKTDLVLYFNYPKSVCYFRVLKRLFRPNQSIDDKAAGCQENIRWPLLKYMWTFNERVFSTTQTLKSRYPKVLFRQINNNAQLNEFKKEILSMAVHTHYSRKENG